MTAVLSPTDRLIAIVHAAVIETEVDELLIWARQCMAAGETRHALRSLELTDWILRQRFGPDWHESLVTT